MYIKISSISRELHASSFVAQDNAYIITVHRKVFYKSGHIHI